MRRLLTIVGLVLCGVGISAQQRATPDPGPWPPPGVAVPGPGVRPPRVLQQVKPRYTADALRSGLQGVVVLGCVVEADGSVGSVRVLQSLDPGLDDAAVAAVRQWTFAPARTPDGSAVPSAIRMELSFRLRDAPEAWPVNAWPDGFSDHTGGDWVTRTIDTDTLRIHVSYPPTWRLLVPPSDPNKLLHLTNGLSTRTVTIGRPRGLGHQASSGLLSPDKLAELAARIRTAQLGPVKPTMNAFGQVETSTAAWLWMDMQVATKDLPNPPPAAGLFETARFWDFASSVDGELTVVQCMMLVPTDATPAQRQAQLDQTRAEFGGIIRRLSMGHR